MNPAILVQGVTKTFGTTTAVDDLNLEIPRGTLCGVIGPNGAGKTTTIRMIMSILFPDRGTLSVLGHASALEAKDRIGYLPEERGVYRKMKVGVFLTYMANLKGVSGADLPARITRSLERVGLGHTEGKRCEELSKGMQQKIQFLAAIVNDPDLLILDEPFSGLDPISARLIRDLILEEHRRGVTIMFSTHVMPQAEEICQHVVMIHCGRKVLDQPLASIRRQYDPRTIRFDPFEPAADVAVLGHISGVERVVPNDNGGYDVVLIPGTNPAKVMPHLAAAVPAARLELSRPRLEDIFVEIAGDRPAPQAGVGA